MAISMEHDVEWIAKCLEYLRKHQYDSIETTGDVEDAWMNHVYEGANATLFPLGTNSWYTGSNIAGKPRGFTTYIGGISAYHQKCKDVVNNGYEGFHLIKQ